MAIWHKAHSVEDVNARGRNTLVEHLGIVVTELGDSHLTATMPVDHRTYQPLGLLHGGASVALAETLASTAGNLVVDDQHYCVGLEINANHVSSCRDGFVTGTSRPIHLGRTTQVWETRIEQEGRLVCLSRMTLAVLQKSRKKT
ncbi:MAG: hotdog fold thioesterase [Oligoflexia bacterium]|nr:hotdog fold thioesterase [Oligoflexia bacterium]